MKGLFALVMMALVGGLALHGQVIPRMDSVQVIQNGNLLRNPGAGGFNVPEFSAIDLDGNGVKDLFVFDRAGRKVLTFLNRGSANQVDYDYAPIYQSAFPSGITDFALLRDYDCDGQADLFFGTNDGVKVYHNSSTPGHLSFDLYRDTLFTDYGAGPALVYIIQGDIPEFVDVDSDGDLDLLSYNAGGNFVEWHRNMVMENTGNCAGLDLEVADRCWGHFEESGLNQALTLGISCRTAAGDPPSVRPTGHSGSTIAAFDEDVDGDYELVIGDLLYAGLTYTHNAGTGVAADVDSIDPSFPSYDASVALDIFPAGYFVDVNNDGKLDMLAAPNSTNTSVNYDNSWYYENIAPNNGVLLTRQKKNFLNEDMVDVGLGSYPTLVDCNADGLLDLVVGNFNRKLTSTNVSSTLFLYENTGSAVAPVFTLTNRNYLSIPTLLTNAPNGLVPAFGDLDGDGDLDLLLGDEPGKLHYLQNTAGVGQVPTYPTAVQNYLGIDVGQFSTPVIVDVDRDGLLDLVVGEQSGTLNYFHNTGTPQNAVFAGTPTDAAWGGVDVQPVCCTGFSAPHIFTNPSTGRYDLIVGSEQGDLFYYQDFESELGDTFTLDQPNFGEILEGGRTTIAGHDLNGDGVWEWLVGNVRGGIGFYSGNGLLAGVHTAAHPVAVDWEVFPNPTTGMVTVRTAPAAAGDLSVRLLDLQGRVVMRSERASAARGMTMDLRGLDAGMYLLRLEVNGVFVGAKRVVLSGEM